MADVFISYKRDDRPAIEHMALQLRELGLTIWFDASMSAGDTFNDEIDREARAAKLILVCWSPAARESRWVKAEAMIGFEQDKLAACYIAGPDGFSPPTPFNTIHAEDLRAWLSAPSDTHAGWKSVLRRIGRLCGRTDIESWGALDAQATASELRAWIDVHSASPLFMTVDELLRTREAQDAERGRLEQAARERRAQEETERRAREAMEEARRENERRLRAAERANAPPHRQDNDEPSNASGTIFALALAAFVSASMRISTNVFAQPIMAELALTSSQLGNLFQSSSVSMMILTIIAGALADRGGANRVYLISAGLALTAIATIGLGLSQNFDHLLGSRLILGIGGGLILAPAMTLVGNITSLRRRAVSLAVIGVSLSVAGMLASSLGAAMAANFGWRVVQMTMGAGGLVSAMLVLAIARDRASPETPPATQSYGIGIALLMFAVFTHTGFMVGVSAWLPSHFIRVWGVPISQVSVFLALPLVGGAFATLIGGALGDSTSGDPRRYVLLFLGSAVLSGATLVAFALSTTSVLTTVALATAASVFAAAWYGVAFAAVQRMSGNRKGLGTGIALALTSLSALLAPIALGGLRDTTQQPSFLYWSGLAGVTALLLFVTLTTLRNPDRA